MYTKINLTLKGLCQQQQQQQQQIYLVCVCVCVCVSFKANFQARKRRIDVL